MQYSDLLQQSYFDNAVENWLTAAMIFAGVFVGLYLFRCVVLSRLKVLAKKTSTTMDDALINLCGSVGGFFYFMVSLFVATRQLSLPKVMDSVVYGLFILALVAEAIRILQKIILFFVERVWLKGGANQEHVSHIIGLLIKIVLWTIGIVLILSNLGFNVSSLVASMGIGGVAIALAVQNILSDMFSSFSIYFDQPFQVGDFIVVGEHKGVVKKIGLKTTRIQALQGEEIVISNAELTSARLQNFKKMQKRRISFDIGVEYGTPVEKLRAIPQIIEDSMASVDDAEFSRAHFKEFADSSLNFEVVYYALTGDYTEYMETRQQMNLGIAERFEKEGISMAFPTRTVHLVKA